MYNELVRFIEANEVLVNTSALIWFLFCWVGYTYFAKYQSKQKSCLASELHKYREQWMQRVVRRDFRVADAALMGNLERHVSFMASTTILILAGLLTVLAVADQIVGLISEIPFVASVNTLSVQLKLLMLTAIFVYAFFTFTWSLRQYGFCSILLGSAPTLEEDISAGERDRYAFYAARVIDLAGTSYNHGLRAYYFALSILVWFLNPLLFVVACTFVLAVLYRREFHSRSLWALRHQDHVDADGNPKEHPYNF